MKYMFILPLQVKIYLLFSNEIDTVIDIINDFLATNQ